MKYFILILGLIFLTGCAQPNISEKIKTDELITDCSQTTFCAENPTDSQCDETCEPCSKNPESECLKGEEACTCNG